MIPVPGELWTVYNNQPRRWGRSVTYFALVLAYRKALRPSASVIEFLMDDGVRGTMIEDTFLHCFKREKSDD